MSNQNSDTRLIEVAFPLKQASLDSVHEKNVRHGHISTLHIWPARRPLAASRAALIATLLRAPATSAETQELLLRLGGRITSKLKTKKVDGKDVTTAREETIGGVLRWGRENEADVQWFREKIRAEFGGRAPRVLDPFAGGGAIPLEALRFGCEVTATDINPVAWLILKCTLEYPRLLSGATHPLPNAPEPSLSSTDARSRRGKRDRATANQASLPHAIQGDLSAHVRQWGEWVLERTREDLAQFYPAQDGKQATAYLWARTISCKNCRVSVPLLKTLWLAKSERARAALAVRNSDHGIRITVNADVPNSGRTPADRKEFDRKTGKGTMTRAGVTCPRCGVITSMEDIRAGAVAGHLGAVMTAVVTESPDGKVFRTPTEGDRKAADAAEDSLPAAFKALPFGAVNEPLPTKDALGIRVPLYGFTTWGSLFLPRQLLAIATLAKHTRAVRSELETNGYSSEWVEAVAAYLAIAVDRSANYLSTICIWDSAATEVKQTFLRFALPITWDFAESNPIGPADRCYLGALSSVCQVLSRLLPALPCALPRPTVENRSALATSTRSYDLILTDPPYYDAIPYSDLMDFFYVWLRRTLGEGLPAFSGAFGNPLAPKWDAEANDGELIDDASRFGGNREQSHRNYEDGMARAFAMCHRQLEPNGRFVIVFANKQPSAWETLVSAIIRAGFVVDGSWPIATEMRGGIRNFGRASLSSSVWLVCRKRPESAKAGWDSRVLEQMRTNIYAQLREFWDAGIRGPDFVWAATGPALEAYSQHPIVKKANRPGEVMTVSEFLRDVRRIVVDFVVGRVLSRGNDEAIAGLDDVTTYYLLHRHDFGFDDVPAGACILYGLSCGLSDRDLVDTLDLLSRTGGRSVSGEEEPSDDNDVPDDASDTDSGSEREGSGSRMRLRSWNHRKRKSMGYDADTKASPLIDQVHRLMHLWKGGDVTEVDEYLEGRALKKNQTFLKLLQALIELADTGSDERTILESMSNHIAVQPAREDRQRDLL